VRTVPTDNTCSTCDALTRPDNLTQHIATRASALVLGSKAV